MSEILYNSIDDDCNPATLDYINLEIVTNKQNYIPNEQVMVTVAAPPGSDTYLTIDSPTNFSYVYIFNDATYPLQQLFTFTGKSGTYNIEAINTYDDFTVTKTNHFEVDNNLNAILNFENNYFEYENIKFTPSISGGVGALSYLWDFGDGTQSTELNPSHTYSTAGKYHVILIILDSEDNDFSIVKEIKIKESYDVKIKVKNNVNGSPIDDAKVRFDSLDNYTNETGDVVFRLSNETYELKVTHSDYDSYSEDIQINGSDEISVSLVPEDNSFPPLISLLYPDDGETFSSSPNLEFKVNDEQNTNCTLYISQGDGWWSEEETKTGLVPNTNYEFNIELDEGTYFWKLECIDVEEIEVFSATREFTIDNNYVGSNNDETNNDADNTNSESGARASSSNVNNNSKEEINETYTAVSEVLDLLPDFSLYSPEQRKVIELLNFDDRIKDLKKDLEKANRDLFNLRYKDNAIDVLDERNALLSQIEEIKNSIPMVLVIEKDNEYVKYINDEDAIELLELYIESKNIEMSKGEKKDFIETNLLLQKKVTVNTRGYNVHIEYMTGRKEDITIIAKRLDFNPIYDDMKIVEFIPKEVITNTDEISFLFEDYEIINKDPMFEISKETKDYSYYINRKLALEVLPQVKTLLITNEIEKSGTLSGITGFAVLDKVGISENSKKIFFVQIIIIFILSGIFIYNNLKYSTVPINGVRDEMLSNFDSNIINKINELISEITILIDSNLLYDAGMKYTELKVLFRDLSINLKDQFYDNIAEKCHHINQRYVSSMIDEAFIHLGNEDYEEALSAYEVINKEYKNLDPKTREEIYPKCCELVALINS
ncbi:PKD domain-containing protein [archaeon]|nr:PKD domain-containing protein [archaeon]MBT4352196.1 PKD domain-containing protein [archaeon]MBT4647319.1 PKD domain-containing protein [archaeon]MBT6821245.1 PKD domain-containing protein [archaeon]MBT7391297.1 PKD domain-containing protein [archaeon]